MGSTMPVPVSNLPALVAHLLSLGLEDGDGIPRQREIVEALGLSLATVKRLTRDLRLAGVLTDAGVDPGDPPRIACIDRLRDLGTPEGMAHFRGEKAEVRAVAAEGATPARGEGPAGAWELVLGRFDDIISTLGEVASTNRAVAALLNELPERIGAVVAEEVAKALATLPVAAGHTLRAVRQKIQTPDASLNPHIAAVVARLGYGGAAKALGISRDSARRYALGQRLAPQAVEQAAAELKNE